MTSEDGNESVKDDVGDGLPLEDDQDIIVTQKPQSRIVRERQAGNDHNL